MPPSYIYIHTPRLYCIYILYTELSHPFAGKWMNLGDEDDAHKRYRSWTEEWEPDIGKVVCLELGEETEGQLVPRPDQSSHLPGHR